MKGKEIILAGLSAVAGIAIGGTAVYKLRSVSGNESDKKIERLKGYYALLNQWLQLSQSNISLERYFLENKYNSIAIYGMGELGMRLYEEIKDSAVKVKCAIDKNAETVYAELPVCYPENCMKDIDVIVVTPTFAYTEIANELSEYVDCPIISLDDVVFGL